MEYKVLNSMKSGEFEGQYGKSFKYSVMLEGEAEAVTLNQKPETPAPKAGDILSGTIAEDQYGRKFKKEQKPNGFSAGFTKSDPETPKQIIRQNSLTNAVNYCIAKANLDKNYKLEGKEVIQVATYFAKYSLGEISIVTENKKPEVVTGDKEDDFIKGLEADQSKAFPNDEEDLVKTLNEMDL